MPSALPYSPPPDRKVLRAASGLTLVELLAVIVILASVTAATLGVSGASAHGAQSAESAIRGALERARAVAIVRGHAELQTDLALTAPPGRPGPAGPGETGPDLKPWALPPGWSATFESGRPVLRFSASGTTDDEVITARDERGNTVRIELLGLSGQVRRLPVNTNRRGHP